jgi:hypothetical protein
MQRFLFALASIAALITIFGAGTAARGDRLSASPAPGAIGQAVRSDAQVTQAVRHAVSAPLRNLAPATPTPTGRAHPARPLPLGQGTAGAGETSRSPSLPAPAAFVAGLSFAGVGNGDYGFAPDAAPPDTNLAVGASQVVQWVNESFAVFDKTTGALVSGPTAGNSLFANLGGGCATNNDGDPIAQYDKLANRWVLTQFSVSTTPYLQCVAVSTTSDATGTYNLYAFSYGTDFPDYGKLGVWPDAYYITFNMFANGSTFEGSRACAYDRAAMLAGAAATQQCFQLSSSFGGLLPSDLDGPTSPPPAGSPNYLLNFGRNSLNLWQFHVDWTTPSNTTLTGPTNIPVVSFATPCRGRTGACVPQPNTSNQLDTLGDRLMYRLAYRNFGDHEALVVNHSVATGKGKSATIGVRWYELRRTSPGAFGVYQQGTYSPDATFRWMGSIAMDKVGDIALGYSASSASVFPSIRLTGRVPTDPLGALSAETEAKTGGGSQLPNLHRWGDYSSMSVDPVDDCTMWYTTEYLKASGTFNWSTWINSFKFSTCA